MMRCLFLLFTAVTLNAADTVRVLSFNLRYINSGDTGEKAWTARRDAAAALIKKDAADFIGVQEAFRSMLDDVKARVPGYSETGAGREDGREKGEYAAILYRTEAWKMTGSGTFWLSGTPDVPGSATWGNTVTRICTWGKFTRLSGGRELFVCNTHFDHESQECREKGAALILQHLHGVTAPVILTGDFNATPENPAITTFRNGPPPLTDVWQALNKTLPPAESGTFHAFKGHTGGPRIDYIFATPDLKPVESTILHGQTNGNFPSDHFPVRATLQLPSLP